MAKYWPEERDQSGYRSVYQYSSGLQANTGYLEDQLLETLPEELIIPLNVATHMLREQLVVPKPDIDDQHVSDRTSCENLNDSDAIIKRHTVQFLYLHLISSTIGTEYEAKLTVPALNMCLLDMVMHIAGITSSINAQTTYNDRLHVINESGHAACQRL